MVHSHHTLFNVLPKPSSNAYEVAFTPSDASKTKAKKSAERDDIMLIDGESFYTKANNNTPGTMKAMYKLMAEELLAKLGTPAKTVIDDTTFETFINAVMPSLRKRLT